MRASIIAAVILAASAAAAQQPHGNVHDPGIRPDLPAGAGGPLPNLPDPLLQLFLSGQAQFEQVEDVTADGLGPRMNLDSCGGCHVNPAIGGTSPAGTSPASINPQVSFYMNRLNHTTNRLPSFIKPDGPVREARFPSDGGVHDLFTIAGMTGAEKCHIAQPTFANNNLIFRIPTPVFGAGLIEQITDSKILANLTNPNMQNQKLAMGIKGRPNIVLAGNTVTGEPNLNGNDGTVSRFGWKAQNKSLLMFAGEAYNVEMGISNELFQTERDETQGCQVKTTPNNTTNPQTDLQRPGLAILSDIEQFAAFMRLLAPPVPSTTMPGGADSISDGAAVFNQIGCGLCHTLSLPTTSNSTIAALGGLVANLFSDLALHHMGPELADGISQGQAGPDEFRTAPLWGLGKRAFFLHDGRTSDLVVAIHQHRSGPSGGTAASEASAVINKFDMLPDKSEQDLLNFLRSL